MLKKVVAGSVICAFLGCLVGVALRNPFVYMAGFDVLVGGLAFALFMLVMRLLGRLIPKSFAEAYRRKRDRLTVIVFFGALIYFSATPVINVKILSHAKQARTKINSID